MVDYVEVPLAEEKHDYDIETVFDGEMLPRKKVRFTYKLVAIIVVISLLCLVLISLSITMGVTVPIFKHKYYYIFGDENILFTSEFQIDLECNDAWIDREEQMDRWMETFEKNCKYFYMDEVTEEVTAVRLQYYEKIKGKSACDCSTEIRVREYVSGVPSVVIVDAKGNHQKEQDAFYLPYTPSNKYFANSTQKCEHDRHQDKKDDKYSRETRVVFPEGKVFSTCADIVDVYPDIEIDKKYYSNPIEHKTVSPWFVREYSGVMDGDTKFKVAFTLDYTSVDNAETGREACKSGEWSIRLFTKQNGTTHEYNEDVLSAVESAWQVISDYSLTIFPPESNT